MQPRKFVLSLTLAAAAAAASVLWWLSEPRLDETFVVLGSTRSLPGQRASGELRELFHPNRGKAISNAWVEAGDTLVGEAGTYGSAEHYYDTDGRLQQREVRFRPGPWHEIKSTLVERELRNGFGQTVCSYRMLLQGAESADHTQWAFRVTMAGEFRTSVTVDEMLAYEPLARRLILTIDERDGSTATRREFAFTIELDGTVRAE